MAIDEAFAVRLLRLAKTMYDRRLELDGLGVTIRGLGEEEALIGLLLAAAGAPGPDCDGHDELFEALHDTMHAPDGVALDTSDEELLVAWRTVLARVRAG